MKLILALAAVSAAYSANTSAQTERDLESHVHGSASLNIALTESSVFIELNSPWNNLVGFEHAPHDEDQRLKVEKALQQLNNPVQLFTFNAGNCAAIETHVESSIAEEHEEHEEHDDHKDEHKAEDEHAEHHDHDDEHKADDEHAEHHDHDDEHTDDDSVSHSAVLANYEYECKQIAELTTINASLFSVWPGFTDLDVQLIGEKGQTLLELDPENTAIHLDQVK